MKYLHQIFSCLLMLLIGVFSSAGFAQNAEGEREEGETEKKHRIAVIIGHAHVPEGIDKAGNKQWLVLPTWGLDYDYRITSRWAVGVHTDIIVENFELEEHFGEEQAVLERSRPLATTLVVTFKPGQHLTYILGGGAEIAPEETFGLIRLGLEYGWELPEEWELGISLMNDFKINAYNSWVLGLGVSKFF